MQIERKKVYDRLRRIEGQVRGLQKLVENEAECVDILIQLAAVTSAMKRTGAVIISNHMEKCVNDASKDPRKGLDELKRALNQFIDAS
jgi:DNA-binding FrmR family transcriptional regulator